MKETRSRSVFSLVETETRPKHYDHSRVHVDLRWVVDHLRTAIAERGLEDSVSASTSGKRKAQSTPQPSQSRSAKRVKRDNDSQANASLWTHTAEIVFASPPEHRWPYGAQLQKEETELESALKALAEYGDESLYIGQGYLRCFAGARAGIYTTPGSSATKAQPNERRDKILSLPVLDDDLGEAMDFPASLHNIIFALGVAEEAGRFDLEPIDISVYRDSTIPAPKSDLNPASLLPLTILLSFRVRVNFATITDPVVDLSFSIAEAQRRVLSFLIPAPSPPESMSSYSGETDIRYFFSCLGPAPEPDIPKNRRDDNALQPKGLKVELLPFQKRSVYFMLQAEGITIGQGGKTIPDVSRSGGDFAFWEEITIPRDSNSSKAWFRRLTGDISFEQPVLTRYSGTMLAETMGLGKTVEIIALVLFHTPISRNLLPATWDPELEVNVKPVKASLIVTPASLVQQWMDEFSTRAPKLKVLQYEGKAKLQLSTKSEVGGKKKGTAKKNTKAMVSFEDYGDKAIETWQVLAQEYDVIITTYQNLQTDLNIARPPVQRSRRDTVDYAITARPRSPLVVLEFTRVVMDEVQQVGGGKAAEMVSLTKRLASVAVSGTPARSDVKDLVHVLRFLRVPCLESNKVWGRLTSSSFACDFQRLFRAIGVRTSKQIASLEMGLAVQTRFLVPIELGPVEKHNYDERMAESLTSLGLDPRGVASSPDWELDVTLLRTAIRKLRQACTHPQVGNAGNKMANSSIRSIDQVLALMITNNKRLILNSRRSLIQDRLNHILFSQKLEGNPTKYKEAAESLIAIRLEIQEHIVEIQKARAEFMKSKSKGARAGVLKRKHASSDSKGKGKGVATSDPDSDSDDSDLSSPDSDFDDDDEPGSSRGVKDKDSTSSGYTTRIREARILLHKANFLLGDVYHQLGNSTQEDAAYATAEEIRKQLLKQTEQNALKAMQQLRDRQGRDATDKEEFHISLAEYNGKNKRIPEAFEVVNDVIGLMNDQSELLWSWKEEITGLLTQQFAQEGAADGEEYARALETQANAECYLVAMSALLADRRETMNAERTTLALHEHKDSAKRTTQRALNALNDAGTPISVPSNPEQAVLQLQLTSLRKALKEDRTTQPLKGVMFDLKKLAKDLPEKEADVVLEESGRIKEVLDDQGTLLDEFEVDMQALRRAFNNRVSYFRNLQELSDSVEDVSTENGQTIPETIAALSTKITDLQAVIRRGISKQRYLAYLHDHYDEESLDEDDKCCVLCKCEFAKGFVTECAHVFCQPCLNAWMKKRPEGKHCPICREDLDAAAMYRITFTGPRAEPVTVDELLPAMPRNTLQYNMIDHETLEQITGRDSLGQFGSKIQTLVKHLLYLKEYEPGSKSIVFSAWSDSLELVAYALQTNGITFLRIDRANTKKTNPARVFQTDPTYQVLLLHGERDNAGLNVTAARHVFLLEPVVNHSFEVQALARVDRLGSQDTEVYCYFAEDTVEKNILDLAYRRGNSLYASQPADFDTDVVGERSEPKQGARSKAQKGDFVASTEDMLAIMFPHMYHPIEELSDHRDEREVEGLTMDSDAAEAGPSRS